MKRIVSALTALVMTCTVFLGVLPVSAEETQSAQPSIENDISIEGMNSFGNLLTDSLDEKMDEQQANNGCNVFSAEVTGNEATVSFETTESCTLLVAVYDEAGQQMLASGSAEVTSEETEKTVTIETDSMPQYFYLRAFLVNTVTLRPICTVYESPNYTQEMQEFFAKTVDDFDSEKVLNLDEDKTNNFAVYNDDVKVIEHGPEKNVLTYANEEENKYTIEYTDDTVSSLQKGDLFTYNCDDGNVLIVKVDSIDIVMAYSFEWQNADGTFDYKDYCTVDIYGQDTSMEEVFDYVKIDDDQNTDTATVDNSNLEEGVTYNGTVESTDNESTYLPNNSYNSNENYLPDMDYQAVEFDEEVSTSLSYKIAEKKIGNDDNNVKLSGSVELKLKGSVKVYVSLSYFYLEFKVDYTAKISASLSGSVKEVGIPLGFIGLSPVAGVYIELTPSIIFEVSGKIDFSGKLSATIGFGLYSDTGYKNLSSAPKFEPELKAEVKLFVGLSFEPKLKIIDESIAEASMEAKIGAEVKAEMPIYEKESSSSKHDCKACIDGEVYGKATLSVKAKILNKEKFTYKFDLVDVKIKICDFYYSFDHQQGGFTTCPYKSYKVSVLVNNKDGNPVNGATLTTGLSNSVYGTTDENGRFEMWCSKGQWKICASKNGMSASKDITVKDSAKSVKLVLGSYGSGGGGGSVWGDSDSNDYNKPDCTDNDYWVVFYEGFRNKRLEMSTFNANNETYIIWNKNLKAVNQEGKCSQYYFNDNNEWEQIGTYSILTDYAVDIVASNVDIYNSNGEIIYAKSNYSDYNFSEYKYYDDYINNIKSSNSISQISYLSNEPALQTKAFTELLPNETYNFYLLKSLENEPFDSDNLLYAGQGVSDESGSLTVSYIPKAEYTNAVIYINGMTRTDISGAKVTVPDILCNGEEQFAQPEVTLDGKTLVFGIDYDIEKAYSAVIPGEYELMISGINDYDGEVSAVYNVYCEHSFSNGKCTICGSLETDKGDVNGDGVTGIADIVALQKCLVKLKTDAAGNADVNGDGVVNVFDDVILRRMILNS